MTRPRLAIAALVVLLLSGCASGPPPQVPDVAGLNGAEAREALEDAGYDVNLEAADGSLVMIASNWTVSAQAPTAGSELDEGEEVTVTVSKPEAEAEAEEEVEEEAEPTAEASAVAPAPAPTVTTTPSGLTEGSARALCDRAGEIQFPYGWDPHWILGLIASEVQGDEWFMKVEVSITNEYDAERDAVIECTVGGTEVSPTLNGFFGY